MAELQIIYAINTISILLISYTLLPKTGILGAGLAYLIVYAIIGFYSAIRLKLDKVI
jgi:O-antigen/teichoic acid export membrane protein